MNLTERGEADLLWNGFPETTPEPEIEAEAGGFGTVKGMLGGSLAAATLWLAGVVAVRVALSLCLTR